MSPGEGQEVTVCDPKKTITAYDIAKNTEKQRLIQKILVLYRKKHQLQRRNETGNLYFNTAYDRISEH